MRNVIIWKPVIKGRGHEQHLTLVIGAKGLGATSLTLGNYLFLGRYHGDIIAAHGHYFSTRQPIIPAQMP